jgi:hypothetical protein
MSAGRTAPDAAPVPEGRRSGTGAKKLMQRQPWCPARVGAPALSSRPEMRRIGKSFNAMPILIASTRARQRQPPKAGNPPISAGPGPRGEGR